MNAARIAKMVEHIRRICEETYNSEKPMQYHEMSQIEQLCDEIEKSQSVFEIAERACKIIGLLTGDSSFCERQRRKIWKEAQT